MKNLIVAFAFSPILAVADTLVISDSPTVVRNAEIREAIRQDSTWTSENIQKNPYLFLQEQIAACDRLKAKIEAQNITLIRMEKKSTRAAEEATSTQSRYEKFRLFCKIGHGIPCPICCMKQHSPSTTGCKHANDRPLWAFDGPGAVFTCSQPCAARFGSTRCEQAA